jgi:hypothetical protein
MVPDRDLLLLTGAEDESGVGSQCRSCGEGHEGIEPTIS